MQCVAVHQCGRDDDFPLLFGQQAPQGCGRKHRIDSKIRIAIERRDTLVIDHQTGLLAVGLTAGYQQSVPCCHTRFGKSFHSAVGAAGRIVGNHERDVVLRSRCLPSYPVHSRRIEEVLLVFGGVVTDFAAADSSLPALSLAYRIPVFLIVSVAGAYLVLRVHERVVEEPEIQRHQLFAVHYRGVGLVGSVDRYRPWHAERGVEMLQESRLIVFGREIGT